MRYFQLILSILLLVLSGPETGWAKKKDSPEFKCPGSSESVTEPAPVDLPKLLYHLGQLQTAGGQKALKMVDDLQQETRDIFNRDKVKTKMEQFYRLLFIIQKYTKANFGNRIELEASGVRETLVASSVFRDLSIPNQIKKVFIDRTKKKKPKYEVQFQNMNTKVPLNNGNGFYVHQSGKCQQSKALIFDQAFSFTLRMLRKGNLKAQKFSGVDLYGDFGSRGWFDVDVEYVSLRSVEFYKGSKLGKIRAYVSRKEFEKNDHNSLLRMITKFVGDTSVQPIDW